MKKFFAATAVSAIAAGAILTGCNSFCPADKGAQLKNSAWTLDISSLKGADEAWEKPARDITLAFDAEGKVSGCAGVNRYFSGKSPIEKDGEIDFGPVGSTMMAGPGLQYESLYLKTLDEADRFSIEEDILYLYDDDQIVAVFNSGIAEE